MTKVNSTAPVSQTGQTRVVRKISIPLIVVQQLVISTHKEAPLQFNFPACIPFPKSSRTQGAQSPMPNLRLGALHIKRLGTGQRAIRPMSFTWTVPAGLPKKAIRRYRATDD